MKSKTTWQHTSNTVALIIKDKLPFKGLFLLKTAFAIFVLLMVFFLFPLYVQGQSASASWPLTASAIPVVSGNVTAASQTSGGVGANTYGTTNGVSSTGWSTATTRDAAKFYQFSITPSAGNSLTVNSVSSQNNTNGNNGTALIQYSYSSSFTSPVNVGGNFSVSTTTPATNTFSALSINVNNGQTIYFRIFAWNMQNTSRTFNCKSFVVSATTVTCPVSATAGNNGPVCSGANLNLFASASGGTTPFTFLWSGPNGFSSNQQNPHIPSASPLESGIYSVTISNSCGSITTSTTAIVNALPAAIITASGPITFCSGSSVNLTANASGSYLWSTGETTQGISVSSSGNFIVTVTDGNGCSKESPAIVVTVNPLPSAIINAEGPTTFCEGGSVNLSANASGSYLWSTDETTQGISVSSSGNFIVTVTDGNGCSKESPAIVVTVNPLPSAIITAEGPTEFCEGGSVNLSATASGSYLWSTGETTQGISISSSGNFIVTVTDGNGCSKASPATVVTVNPLPSAIITAEGPTEFCEGGSVNLSANASGSYLWSTGETTQGISVSSSGNFIVTVTDGNGCSGISAEKTITVVPLPEITVSPIASVKISDSPFLLTGGSPAGGNFSGNGISSGVLYPAVAGAGEHIITYSYTNPAGCSNEFSFPIQILPIPLTGIVAAQCGKTLLLMSQIVNCTAVADAVQYEWEWSNNSLGFLSSLTTTGTGANPSLLTGIEKATTYSVRVRARVGAVWGEFGSSCLITTPPQVPSTKVRTQDCGITLSVLNQTIYCDAVAGAGYYQWEWVHSGSGFIKSVTQTVTSFIPSALVTGIQYGKTYNVRVRAKVGLYWGDYSTVCQITTPATIPLTKIRNADCGITLSALNQTIYCDPVIGAGSYQWEWVHSASGFIKTASNTVTSFVPSALVTGIQYGKTYSIRVRAQVGGVWGEYSTVCQITTPATIPLTKVRTADCGITLAVLNQTIYCDPVIGAGNYQWEWVHSASGFIKTASNTVTSFVPSTLVTGIQYGKTYSIRVRAQVGGVWGEFATVCQITTPATIPLTKVRAADCGITLSVLNQTIYCDVVPGAGYYEWEWVNSASGFSAIVSKTDNSLLPSTSVPGIQYGRTYDIRVRAQVGGIWGGYGNVCQITTPATIPLTKVLSSYCGATLTSLSQSINCSVVPGAGYYQWEWINSESGFSQTVTKSGTGITPSTHVTGIQYGKTYDVRVRAQVGGVWGEFGVVCQVTTPVARLASSEAESFQTEQAMPEPLIEKTVLSVFPNPSSGVFNIGFTGISDSQKLHVEMYDMNGRMVFSQGENIFSQEGTIAVNSENTLLKGIYQLRISLGGNQEFRKVVIQ